MTVCVCVCVWMINNLYLPIIPPPPPPPQTQRKSLDAEDAYFDDAGSAGMDEE